MKMYLLSILLCFLILLSIKNCVTCIQITKIINAIRRYQEYRIRNNEPHLDVNYAYIKSYSRVLWRLWDWGYKNILPKEQYEIIKDYIK